MNTKKKIKLCLNEFVNSKLMVENSLKDFNISEKDLLEILNGYLEAALWTEEERLKDDYENEFNYSEDIDLGSFSVDDLDDNSKIQAYIDINRFIWDSGVDAIKEAIDTNGLFKLGMDIWLTRNGHGAGFFDHSYENEESLMKSAEKLKGVDLYLGDDLKLYFTNSN
jgi:hypothetical protein